MLAIVLFEISIGHNLRIGRARAGMAKLVDPRVEFATI